MTQLAPAEDTKKAERPSRKRQRSRAASSFESKVVTIQVPKAYNDTWEEVPFRCFLPGCKRGTAKNLPLWVHEEDLPWLVKYMGDEYDAGGLTKGEDSEGSADDSSAVAEDPADAPETPQKRLKSEVKIR